MDVSVAVLGLGSSLDLFRPEDFRLMIGVNDIWSRVKTDVVVCVDYPQVFTPKRIPWVRDCRPQAFYSHFPVWENHFNYRKITLEPGYPDIAVDLHRPGLWKSYCSPFVAVQIAYRYYDANIIHLFGVDMINHPHLDKQICQTILSHFRNLQRALIQEKSRIVVHGDGILKSLNDMT